MCSVYNVNPRRLKVRPLSLTLFSDSAEKEKQRKGIYLNFLLLKFHTAKQKDLAYKK